MEKLLQIVGIKKHFLNVKALNWKAGDTVSFNGGDIWGLVGENGAGKSTLLNLLSGILSADQGEFILDGKPYKPKSRQDARDNGVSVVLQEPGLINSLTVAENIFLGREELYTTFGITNYNKLNDMSIKVLNEVSLDIDPKILVYKLNFEEQKLVELARAISLAPKVLIVDETSAALSKENINILFTKMREMKAGGSLVIFVSHRLEEILNTCDKIVILKDGELIKTLVSSDTNINELSKLMVGRELKANYRKRVKSVLNDNEQTLLKVKDLAVPGKFSGLSFELNKGEILGIGGLAGAGQEYVLPALFGDISANYQSILLEGREIEFLDPRKAIKLGFGYASKNRDDEGLILQQSICSNITLPVLDRIASNGFINQKKENKFATSYCEKFNVKCNSIDDLCMSLSGGNRQKVVLSRWIASQGKVLLLDNPTRGIDVGAKAEIYSLMNELVNNGLSIIMVSDELPELIDMSDKIILFRRGKVVKEIESTNNPSEHDLISYMV